MSNVLTPVRNLALLGALVTVGLPGPRVNEIANCSGELVPQDGWICAYEGNISCCGGIVNGPGGEEQWCVSTLYPDGDMDFYCYEL